MKRTRIVGILHKQAVAHHDMSSGNAEVSAISMNFLPATGPASGPTQPRPNDASMSGPTSGNASEEEATAHRSICQADQVLPNNNAIRQMSVKKCTVVGDLKTGMVFGDSLVMTAGGIICTKDARVEISVCGVHLGEYREHVTDVGREKDGYLARGLLVKICEDVVRERNAHIGIRITNETETQKATGLKAKTDAGRASQ